MSPDCCQQDFDDTPDQVEPWTPPKTRKQRRKEARAARKKERKLAALGLSRMRTPTERTPL